jgi:hypothetical protein
MLEKILRYIELTVKIIQTETDMNRMNVLNGNRSKYIKLCNYLTELKINRNRIFKRRK